MRKNRAVRSAVGARPDRNAPSMNNVKDIQVNGSSGKTMLGQDASKLNGVISSRQAKEFKRLEAKHGTGKTEKATVKKTTTNADPKGIGSNWVYKAAGAGVTGALVLNMFGNKGQQSNSQLYGQGY